MMPEILTESFCERCGTRYTFESAAPRKTRRLGQFKTLSKGMKNWVMSDDTSLDEAMAAARNDDDRELTSQQLDAFHATFNFCMTCRQYTCANCWNTAEGRCLTCAPHLGHEILPAPFPDQPAFEPMRIEAEAWPEMDLSVPGLAPTNGNGSASGHGPDVVSRVSNGHAAIDPWAATGSVEIDGIPEIDPAARLAFLSGEAPTAAPELADPAPAAWSTLDRAPTDDVADGSPLPAATQPTDAAMADAWPSDETGVGLAEGVSSDASESGVPAALVDSESHSSTSAPEAAPPTVTGTAHMGAARTADLLRRFRPGQNIDAELAAYEASVAETSDEPAVPAAAMAAAPEAVQGGAIPTSDLGLPDIAATEMTATEVTVTIAATAEARAGVPDGAAVAASPIVADAAEVTDDAPLEPPVVAMSEPLAAAAEPVAAPSTMPAPERSVEEPAASVPEPRTDQIQQPTWQIFAPDPTAPSLPEVAPPVAPSIQPKQPSGSPQWPVRPDQVESPAMALLANRAKGGPSDGLWAASAQEVVAPAARASGPVSGVQPCSSCGLSLSATARFCRRCGTRQG